MPPSPRAPLWLLLALLGALSCDDTPDPVAPQSRPGCQANRDCPEGLKCREGVCLGGEIPEWRFALRLIPNTDSAYGPADVLDFSFSKRILRVDKLTLWPWESREGRVATPEGVTVLSEMTARGTNGIDPPPLSFSANAISAGEQFRINLMAWWPTHRDDRRPPRYAVRLEPADLPPYSLSGWTVPSTKNILFELPDANTLMSVQGEVRLSEANPLPQRGLSVTAVDRGGRRVATIAETDDLGRFEIKLWPGSGSGLTLKIRSTDPDRPLPQLEVPLDLEETDPLVLHMGEFDSLFEVQGAVEAEEGPIAGARVRLRGRVGAGTFEVNTDTQEDGRFSAKLYPGQYLIDVEPPAPYRLTRIQEALVEGRPLLITPQNKTPVFARVVDPAGGELVEARVTAELLHPYWPDPQLEDESTPPLRRVETQTDSLGAFVLQLDPGEHEITIAPAVKTGLPSARFSLQIPGRQPVSHVRFEIPPAVAVALRLINPEEEALEGVVVEAWRLDGADPQRVGQGITDTNGEVILSLPNF